MFRTNDSYEFSFLNIAVYLFTSYRITIVVNLLNYYSLLSVVQNNGSCSFTEVSESGRTTAMVPVILNQP